MAGISAKEIKTRIRSMESTRQITKAMELVASSKLRRAQAQVLNARPYFESLSAAIGGMMENSRDAVSPYLTRRPGDRVCYVVIAGDRGLAGGYNSNVLKLALADMEGKEVTVLPIGKKAADFFRARKLELLTEQYLEAEKVTVGDCFTIAKLLSRAYLAGQFDEICLVCTDFVSALAQIPVTRQLLPLLPRENPARTPSDILYEPDSAAVFDAIVPEYLGGIVYGALCESRCAEQAARRTAMDSATQNADEMIESLSLKFNRARQGAITQEITEIVAASRNS